MKKHSLLLLFCPLAGTQLSLQLLYSKVYFQFNNTIMKAYSTLRPFNRFVITSNNVLKAFLLLTFFGISGLSSNLIAQSSNYDANGFLAPKLIEVENLEDGEMLVLTQSERNYIQKNLDKIRDRKKVVKRDLKKAEALNDEARIQMFTNELSDLVEFTEKYYTVLYSASED
jgi:hypothetical protein